MPQPAKTLLATICASALVVAAPVAAHHSFAMFDHAKEVTVTGTVKQFQWTNPHIFVQLVVPNAAGQLEEWSIEGASPNMLFRQGWSDTTFKTGDKATLTINPLKSGGRGGSLIFATLPGGKTVGSRTARIPG